MTLVDMGCHAVSHQNAQSVYPKYYVLVTDRRPFHYGNVTGSNRVPLSRATMSSYRSA